MCNGDLKAFQWGFYPYSRQALAKAEGYEFSAEEFNEMAEKGEIDIDQPLSYIAKTYESRSIRLFVRSGTGLFEELVGNDAGRLNAVKLSLPAATFSGFYHNSKLFTHLIIFNSTPQICIRKYQ